MGYLRHPKTTHERKAAPASGQFLMVDGVRIKVRAARNMRNIPNAWDDIPASKEDRSWKKHRKTKYR